MLCVIVSLFHLLYQLKPCKYMYSKYFMITPVIVLSHCPWLCNFFSVNTRFFIPDRVAQSVTCLATDASLTADPGVASSILAWSHTFVEMDYEIISMVILLPSAESFKKGCCQLQAKVCARSPG